MGKHSALKRDIYYRKGKSEGYRARSAYKLLHLNEQFDIFKGVDRVVDLCAAPGSWSQVLTAKLNEGRPENDRAKIVAVDLQPMAPLPGVIQIEGDITSIETSEKIVTYFEGEKAQLVVCDGAPDVTGLHDLDEFVQSQLLLAALNITLCVLAPGGTFISKIFRARDTTLLYDQLSCFFTDVQVAKPRSSRNGSVESFVVCRNYSPPENYRPSMSKPLLLFGYDNSDEEARIEDEGSSKDIEELELLKTSRNQLVGLRKMVRFVACGDLSGYDSDTTYPLSESDHLLSSQPIQAPVNPPHKEFFQLKRSGELEKLISTNVQPT